MTLSINAAECYRSLPESERSYVTIPVPHWIKQDPLQKSFSRYPDLWFGGSVVWGRIIQVNQALFSDGDGDAPGDVLYDPSGTLDHSDLADSAQKLFALKGTQPTDASLRDIANHLTDEFTRSTGMPIPRSISHSPLLMSTVLFHRQHLPDGKLTLSHFPVLINDRFPGVVMILPCRWWPDDLLASWLSQAPKSHPPAQTFIADPQTKPRICTHCKVPMRKLGLAAHYQRSVEIDVCEPCTLIWFDDTESVRLAGPGLTDLMQIIHAAMKRPRPMQSLPVTLPCPICAGPLKRVANISRYGKTAQLECISGHGALQSFALFLAEKGYFRPYSWADIKTAIASGKRMSCFNCGASLESHPQDECPYCKSPVGMIDPARLASAIDTNRVTEPLLLAPKLNQAACPCCGGAIDLTAEMVCPHCKAVVRPEETRGALAASEAVASQVRSDYARQSVDVSRRKLNVADKLDTHSQGLLQNESLRRAAFIVMTLVMFGAIFLGAGLHKMQMASGNVDGRPLGMSPAIYEGVQNARREAEMAKTPHAPSGVVPPELELVHHHRHAISIINRSTQRLKLRVNLIYEFSGNRCKMTNTDMASDAGSATTGAVIFLPGASHDFVPENCDEQILTKGKYEYAVWSIDADRYIFKSDSAFF